MIDSVGFTGDPLFGEGTRLTSIGATAVEHAFARKVLQDTNNNAADFVLVSTSGATIGATASALGAPNPAALASPLHDNASIASAVADATVGAGASPNRDRCTTCTSTNAPLGTLTFRRRFTNNTGQTITRLRFHIMELSTLNNTEGQASPADLRQLTSASTTFPNATCVQGTMVEQPAVQVMGAGLNSTVTVDLSGDATTACNDDGTPGLSNGEGVNVQWVLGVQTAGNFKFLVYVEALPHGGGSFFVTGNTENASPTAAPATISGRITTADGSPLAGVSMNLSGARTAKVITDANGNYRFENVDGDNFYTVTPALVNYHFAPASQSFSLAANNVDAAFTATRDAVSSGNAIDTADYFVRQHYLDFLGREPDESGFNFWSDQISSCGSDAGCRERRTINVSAAYFLSIEFQQTGGLVDGLYRASYGRAPRYAEFMPDTATVAQGVVVGGNANWAQLLESNKQAFVAAWVQRSDFRAAYDGLANNAFVDALLSHTGGFNGDRAALVSGLDGGSLTRAAVLRQVVENEGFVSAKHNEMFVMMEYFGYLRRDPDASGYAFWLNKLNQFDGNFERAEMVKAFIVSGEYRQRFSH